MSRDQFFKYKKLQAFALREYKEKRPKRVVVRQINSIKLLPKQIVQTIKFSGDMELNPFLLLSDFGSEIRLYFLLPDCTMLGAENYTSKEFQDIESKIKKYSKKVLMFPQKTADEKFDEKRTPYQSLITHMKNLKLDFKELEAKFAHELNSLSQSTGLKGSLKNITLTDKPTDNKRFGVIVDKHKLYINVRFLNSPLIEGIIYRECLFELVPKYMTCDLTDFCSFGAYLLLSGENKGKWLEKWRETSNFDENYLNKASRKDIKKIFGLFGFIQPYLDKKELSDLESIQLIDIILENFEKSNRFVASIFFEYLANENKDQIEIFDIVKAKQLLFQYLDKQELIERVVGDELKFSNLSLNLINMQLFEFYSLYDQIKDIPVGLDRLFQEYLREYRPLRLELKYLAEINFNDSINFQIVIRNKSNLSFEKLKIKDSFEDIFNIIEEDEAKIEKIGPKETVIFNYKLNPIKIGNFKLKSTQISCEDNFKQKYILKSKPIKININE